MSKADRAPYVLEPDEARTIAEHVLAVSRAYPSFDDPGLMLDLPYLAGQLPYGVQRHLREFAMGDRAGYCVVRGHLVDQERIGPTPEHWRARHRPGPEFPEEILLLLYSALLGEPFGWATQQDGVLVHDIFPVRAHENDQLGLGSRELLTWHTEDAFHPYRGDFLLLAALRNPDHVPTTVGELDVSALSPHDVDVLFQERFHIAPDESHLPKNNSTGTRGGRFDGIQRMLDEQRPVAVLFGDREAPCLRLDPYFMAEPTDAEAARAFRAIVEHVDARMRPVVADVGDLLVLNNHRAVHGRLPFRARYDGTDRWLKRVCVTADLAKSRDMRAGAESRLLG
ncbi:arginine beta-hydroxylase, Fe(II)/alpha-ketoglutarate-dependent [Saccharopolyspora gregorii]|uniref:Clavaminate synthase family protein n=1 Tax=Saccharopolyspora gregorii TaxID=33914 RepID=A0ABP6RTE9_9PSEU|nr:arginine beta-hydroxylase, Fe(II)/alpha-ketoglutarate-dependent [Saccharopolyspora gregorii]